MAEVIKILGQLAPAASTYSTLYTVTAGKSAVVSSISVCNTNASQQRVRVHLVPNGGSEGIGNALYYDVLIPANETLGSTMGFTMAALDFVRVYADSTGICFQIFGSEVG